MRIKFSDGFVQKLTAQVEFIAIDKPMAARKFKNDLLKNSNKDLKNPFHFRKSIYFENEMVRDYIFKGYTIVYKIDLAEKEIIIFGFIKYKASL